MVAGESNPESRAARNFFRYPPALPPVAGNSPLHCFIDTNAVQRANYPFPLQYPPEQRKRRSAPSNEQMSDMTAMRVSHSLESTLDSVNRAEEVASDFATKIGFDEETVNRISMAVREAA